MNVILLKDLKPKLYFTKPLYLDENFILLTPEVPVDEALIKRLSAWEYRETRTEGVATEAMSPDENSSDKDFSGSILTEAAGDADKLDRILAFYIDFMAYIESVYTRFVTKSEIDYKTLIEKMKALYQLLVDDRRLLLRAQSIAPEHKNYLVSHALRCSVYSIVLGGAIKLPPFKLIELAAAAALHEIGMIKLPPQIYMAGRPLAPQEKKALTAHPVLGYNLLKEQGVPLAVCLAALEHHERVNGSGYPRALTSEKISLYSKIIMVTCSYDAVTASRPYKEAKDGYSGMVDILKNEGKQYDDTVIKALVYSLSIFPIGTHVMLSNGKGAVVVDVNPENPRYPVVQVFGVKNPDGTDLVIRTGETGLKVSRPMSRSEIEKIVSGG
jgi:HD-GYP domain-containing protein (c-di-GMP phosphodiesterase class II)